MDDRAQTAPRFIGDSTWMSRTGETEPLGIRVFASSMMHPTAASGSSAVVRKASGRQRLIEVGGVAASLLTRLTANWRGGLSPTSLLGNPRRELGRSNVSVRAASGAASNHGDRHN